MRKSGVLLALGCVLALPATGAAEAALVKVGNLVLRADGGFTPRELPRRAYAPIQFQGHASISSARGGLPPAVQRIVLYFDRDGRVFTRGLAVCTAAKLDGTGAKVARRRCRGAIVGTGHVSAAVPFIAGNIRVRSTMTLFNGPRQSGGPSVVVHARAPAPLSETYVLVVPLKRLHGAFSYRATIDVPPIAGGAGVLTHGDMEVGRRFRFRGRKRSYTLARCSDGILETRGHLSFSDGTIIDGSIFKPCTATG